MWSIKPIKKKNIYTNFVWILFSFKLLNLLWQNLLINPLFKSIQLIQKFCLNNTKLKLTSLQKTNFTTQIEFKSLYLFNPKNQPNKFHTTLKPVINTNQNQMFKLFKTFLQVNLFTSTHIFKTHTTWKSLFLSNTDSIINIISINKVFTKWKEFYYLMLNLFYFNIQILFFGTSFFKKELLAFNWKVSTQINYLWRYIQPLLYFKSNKIINYGDFLFRKLKLSNFNIALILDTTYHNKTIYYLHKVPFYTIGLVPINCSYYTVNFAIPTSSDNLFTQLFFIKFLVKTKKITKNIEYSNLKNLWLDFYKFI